MKTNKLGVLGGMGPAATSVFFERVISRTEANCDQEHLNMVILNHTTIPDRTRCIERGEMALFLQAIEPDLKTFEALGVDCIAIPCNTSHFFYKDMTEMTSVPIINMVTETIDTIYEKYGGDTRVGVLSTDGVLRSGVYSKACETKGIDVVVPDEDEQREVMRVIYGTKAGENVSVEGLEAIITRMLSDEGCAVVVLACTELSILTLRDDIQARCVDAMNVLVEKAIVNCGKKIK